MQAACLLVLGVCVCYSPAGNALLAPVLVAGVPPKNAAAAAAGASGSAPIDIDPRKEFNRLRQSLAPAGKKDNT